MGIYTVDKSEDGLRLRLWRASGIAVKCKVWFRIALQWEPFCLQVSLGKIPNIFRVFRSQFICQLYN